MRNRIAALLIAGIAVTGALSGAGVASAKRGADDPAGHISQSQGADDPAGHISQSQGADDTTGQAAGVPAGTTSVSTSNHRQRGKSTTSNRRNGRNPNKGGV